MLDRDEDDTQAVDASELDEFQADSEEGSPEGFLESSFEEDDIIRAGGMA
jgi:hypothetical protein